MIRQLWLVVFLIGTIFMTVGAANAQPRRQMTWRGEVDDTAVIYIRGDRARTAIVSGKSASHIDTDFSGRLPRRPVNVFLERKEGRGRIRIIQQPSGFNDYTAAVRIHDPQSGSGRYSFTLGW